MYVINLNRPNTHYLAATYYHTHRRLRMWKKGLLPHDEFFDLLQAWYEAAVAYNHATGDTNPPMPPTL